MKSSPSISDRGYSVIELLVAMIVTSMIIVGVLNVFDLTSRVGRVQTQVADMQQSMRFGQLDVVKLTRMAGRGGLPRGTFPTGTAIAVRNNVAAGTRIAPATATSPVVAENTDVLTVRGVFDTPIFQIDASDTAGFNLVGVPPTEGTVVVYDHTPTGVPLDLSHFKETKDRPDAILLVSPLGEYAVVQLTPGASTFVESGGQITETTLAFKISSGTHTAAYAALNVGGVFPSTMRAVSFVGILEEHRFYIRDDVDRPALSRARVYPGTDAVYDGDAALFEEDIADNILDLQIALGVDTDINGLVEDTEWLFDEAADDPSLALWNGGGGAPQPPLFYVRLNTLARTERPDRGYTARAIANVEDHVYGESTYPGSTPEIEERAHRRRVFQTTVNVRNL